jgi:hypothetical protein
MRRSAAPVPQAQGLADLSHLRVQVPLPDTADELCQVARSIGADVNDIRVGARATETEIKHLSTTSRPATWVPAWHPSVWVPFVVVGEGGSGK